MAENKVSKIKARKELVEKLLREKPIYQDSDEQLLARIWFNEVEVMGFDPKVIRAWDLLKLFAAGKLSSAEEIARARRIVQVEHQELRGKTWNARHGMALDVKNNSTDLHE